MTVTTSISNRFDPVSEAKRIARENYDKGYGWQVFTECYSDEDLARDFGKCRTYTGLLRKMTSLANLRQERCDEVMAEVF